MPPFSPPMKICVHCGAIHPLEKEHIARHCAAVKKVVYGDVADYGNVKSIEYLTWEEQESIQAMNYDREQLDERHE